MEKCNINEEKNSRNKGDGSKFTHSHNSFVWERVANGHIKRKPLWAKIVWSHPRKIKQAKWRSGGSLINICCTYRNLMIGLIQKKSLFASFVRLISKHKLTTRSRKLLKGNFQSTPFDTRCLTTDWQMWNIKFYLIQHLRRNISLFP